MPEYVYSFNLVLYSGIENFEGAKWNFHKYLVDSHGQVVGGWGPDVGMDLIESKIDEAVAEARLRDEL